MFRSVSITVLLTLNASGKFSGNINKYETSRYLKNIRNLSVQRKFSQLTGEQE